MFLMVTFQLILYSESSQSTTSPAISTFISEATKSTTTRSSTTDGDNMIVDTQSTQLLAKTTVTTNIYTIATSTDILSDVTINTNTIAGNGDRSSQQE